MFDLQNYLQERARLVSDSLATALSESQTPDVPSGLREAMLYALLGGGKRIRPILCLAAAEVVGGSFRTALPAAMAVEALHAYTLVHDDLPCMDDDLLRRGMPTVHAKFGQAEAVLAGDALQAWAFELLGRLEVTSAQLRLAVSALCHAAGPAGVVGGQWEDVKAAPPFSEALVAYVHQHKTACLLGCATRLGAIAGSGSTAQIDQLERFGLHLGRAFQIVDDLLDEDEWHTKPQGELNCLGIWSPDEARRRAANHTQQALAALDDLPGPTTALRALVVFLLERKA